MKLLEVRDLKTYFHIRAGTVKAVDGVSFGLDYGETLGLVGESGCGKTTSALSVAGLLPKEGKIEGGEILLEGADLVGMPERELANRRWKDVSIVFQGAMNALNPVIKIGRQISEAIVRHEGIPQKEALERAGRLLEYVEIPKERINGYPHEFSGGMKQRVMIAMALACSPKLIIGDEPTTALDVMVQAQILDLFVRLRGEYSMGLILITHDLAVLGEICDSIAVMYAGKIVESGTVPQIFKQTLHPYTKKLIECFPAVGGARNIPEGIPGVIPNMMTPPPGCAFHPRCEHAAEVCKTSVPPMRSESGGHCVACHFARGA